MTVQQIVTKLLSSMVNSGLPKQLVNDDLVQILSLPYWRSRKVCYAISGQERHLLAVRDLCHLAARTAEELSNLDQI